MSAMRPDQAQEWWTRRAEQPEHQELVTEWRAEMDATRARAQEHLVRLTAEAEAFPEDQHIQDRLAEAMTRDACTHEPPEPNPKENQKNWEDFLQAQFGVKMPETAAYQAQQFSLEYNAPPDINGQQAEYYEKSTRYLEYDHDAMDRERLAASRQAAQIRERQRGIGAEMGS